MGVTPQEDELAIIENLTKNLIKGSENRRIPGHERQETEEEFGTFGSYNFNQDLN